MSEDNSSTGGEFEREPVPDSALLDSGKFWGMYAGEHAAGTEFMIGPLFLSAGASLQDLILGLLLGNALAVLTWRFLVTPIAMAKRMTLYYQLERIAGGALVIPSHQMSRSGVRPTFVKTVSFPTSFMPAGLEVGLVPGATPK